MKRTFPSWEYELAFLRQQYAVIGIDEVGRGALAGPVCAAGFCVTPASYDGIAAALQGVGVCDSKMLTPEKRKSISGIIRNQTSMYAISYSSVESINETGIVQATHAAMKGVIDILLESLKSEFKCALLIDGYPVKDFDRLSHIKQKALVKGDSKSMTIAAASILAKVHRDELMNQMSLEYPGFEWGINKGYGTEKHRKIIKEVGPTKHHRKLFIRNIFGA